MPKGKPKYIELIEEFEAAAIANAYKVGTLSTYVEEISDDFHSTFAVVSDNVLANMLGSSPMDFHDLTRIVRKYIPGAKLKFTKTGQLKDDYDIYLIELEEDCALWPYRVYNKTEGSSKIYSNVT